MSAKQKITFLCIHGVDRNGFYCKDCPGRGICKHKKRKYDCNKCYTPPSEIRKPLRPARQFLSDILKNCEHKVSIGTCHLCKLSGKGGQLLCEHLVRGKLCNICNPSDKMCIHSKLKSTCGECGGEKICCHGERKVFCGQCKKLGNGGRSLCVHNILINKCVKCQRPTICSHNNRRIICKECKILGTGGENICDHMLQRDYCIDCKTLGIGGGNICEHLHHKLKCGKCFKEGKIKKPKHWVSLSQERYLTIIKYRKVNPSNVTLEDEPDSESDLETKDAYDSDNASTEEEW